MNKQIKTASIFLTMICAVVVGCHKVPQNLKTENQVLAAFEKVKDMEVDGEKVNPLMIDGSVWQDSTLPFLQSSFGAGWLDENEEYMDITLQPQTKKALKFLNIVMCKGYAQPKQINKDIKELQDAIQNKQYLCFIGNINNTGVMMDEWISSGPILSNDENSPVFGVSIRATTGWISTFVSKQCEHPKEVAEFIDYMTSEEGFIQEAAEMNAIFDKKAHFFASENFPFGSEMVYDSTAFEAVYGYGKRIHSEHVMAAAAKASFANRGKQPVWYLYNTDVRGGGDTEWNASYMTQLGEYPLIDYALDEGHLKEDWILSYYNCDGSFCIRKNMTWMYCFKRRQRGSNLFT